MDVLSLGEPRVNLKRPPILQDEGAFSRVVLQRTRAGRGGKWVTRVLPTPAPTEAQLEALARELRRALGTGAHTEEGALVVQGDIADRIEEWFRKRSVSRIIR